MELSTRPMNACGGWLDKKCYKCGQYFKQDEQIVLIVPKSEYKIRYNKLSRNVIMHLNEYEELSKECNGDEKAIMDKLGKHTKKRVKESLSEDQQREGILFKQVCKNMGFHIETNTKEEIHMRKSGTSLTLEYNPRTKGLSARKKGNTGLMDRLLMTELAAKVYNNMHIYIGDGLKNEFTAKGIIDNAMINANKLMGTEK